MRGLAARAVLLVLLCLSAPAGAQPLEPLQEAGRRLFTGLAAQLPGGEALAPPRHACSGCHGRDARGGREGDVPAIRWQDLKARGYDAGSFERALAAGIAAEGRELSRLMPRMPLTAGQISALRAYLETGAADQTSGITADTIRFGVSGRSLPASDARAYAATLQRALAAHLGPGGVYGRQVAVELIARDRTPAEIAARYVAVLGVGDARSREAAELLERGVPLLFPLSPLAGREDATLLRGFSASWRAILSTLAEDIAASGTKNLAIVADTPADRSLAMELQNRIRLQTENTEISIVPDEVSGALEGAETVVLFGAPATKSLPRAARVYLFTSRLGRTGLPAAAPGTDLRLVIEAPMLLEENLRSGHGPVATHAGLAARVLAVILSDAGRSVTRARLVQAFDQAEFPGLALDYGKDRLAGNGDVRILSLPTR